MQSEKKAENEKGSPAAVNLRGCFEELLKFTLYSHVTKTLEFEFQHLGFSTNFCSTLLKHDPDPARTDPYSDDADLLEGVPPYPLYRCLASDLWKCITCGVFCRTCNPTMIHENSSMNHKRNEWQKLIMEKGSEIVNILKSVAFELHAEEPFFSHLKDGLKTIEGRCAGGKFSRIQLGNWILFNKSVVFEVEGVRWYPTFSDMLQAKALEKILPGVENVEEGVKVYRRFYMEEKEQANGVLAITVSKLALQPYISLAGLFSGLSYEGVQCLLGLMHTTGTIPDALPLPRSNLLASFSLPYRPNVKGSALTQGARALAKHTHRSSEKYWGSFEGSASNKNRLAMDVINNLMVHCRWLNMHVVPPHGVVFEIRVAGGYGARWTEDGCKFIGFLEPYTQDGHSKGWKH